MNNLAFQVVDEIATITIQRPKALNALNTETLTELHTLFEDITSRKDIRVVILTGDGEKSFVAGADISEMVHFSAAQARAFCKLAAETFFLLENLPQATIAAVNGFALGGGCELAMACDIRISSDRALFGQPEVGLGIIPGFGGTQRLARLIGKGRAKELIFTGSNIKSEEAYRIGLVNHVVPKEELMDYCLTMAKQIASNGTYAVSLAKSAINLGLDMDIRSGVELEANLFGLSCSSSDKAEGMNAFLEKRKPNLTDF
ncbi:MAG: enoyl-CoA hydratase/isomerase family protein [Lachnospiraceae bacterium]|nr:enoyl-CoA hydratase/isomerase family protein [Lachnospiraceae bacterium]